MKDFRLKQFHRIRGAQMAILHKFRKTILGKFAYWARRNPPLGSTWLYLKFHVWGDLMLESFLGKHNKTRRDSKWRKRRTGRYDYMSTERATLMARIEAKKRGIIVPDTQIDDVEAVYYLLRKFNKEDGR